MRLGDYLQHLEGREEVARLLEDNIGIEELEKNFLDEPWKEGLSIVKVVDPTGFTRPFIEVANIKAKDHQNCPFSIHTRLKGCIKIFSYVCLGWNFLCPICFAINVD